MTDFMKTCKEERLSSDAEDRFVMYKVVVSINITRDGRKEQTLGKGIHIARRLDLKKIRVVIHKSPHVKPSRPTVHTGISMNKRIRDFSL